MGIGIFLTALFEVFRLNDCFFVKKDEGSTIGGLLLLPIAQSVHTVWDQSQTDGSIKSQSAAAKKRFLQIRSDALLRLFVSRQVDPASHVPPIHQPSRPHTHFQKRLGGECRRRHTTRRIPTISYVAVPKISDTRSSPSLLSKSSWERTTTTRRTRQSREVAISSPLATRHD